MVLKNAGHASAAKLLAMGMIMAAAHCASAADIVTYQRDGKRVQLTGKIVVAAQDGGLMLLAPDGKLWTVQPEELIERKQDEAPFKPLEREELAKQLLAELPLGFETHATSHYLICHNTSRAYAQWCGALLERLYGAFTNYWKQRGFKLHDSEMPLVVLVFADRDSYAVASTGELGENARNIVGYYSLKSNRVAMFDLTGVEAVRQPGDKRTSSAQINALLARPAAESMVATVVHEATHQIAYNCGLHARFADIPLWVAEGLAVYFEAPDLTSAKGWRTIGEVNRPRLARFREYITRRPAASLASLVGDDKRFRDPRQAIDAYAEAWALNYFLLRAHPEEYRKYLAALAAKGPLVWDTPEERLKLFRDSFGQSLATLDTEFIRHIERVR